MLNTVILETLETLEKTTAVMEAPALQEQLNKLALSVDLDQFETLWDGITQQSCNRVRNLLLQYVME